MTKICKQTIGYINSRDNGSSSDFASAVGQQGPPGSQGPTGSVGSGFTAPQDGNFDIERKDL